MLQALSVGQLIGGDECLEDVEHSPRMLLGNLAFDYHSVVDGVDAGLAVIA